MGDTLIANFRVLGASEVKQDYSASLVKTQLDNPASFTSTVYVQPLGGLRTKLFFPYLKKLKEKLGNIAINRAELIVPVITGTDNPLKPAQRLTLYRFDIAGQKQIIPDLGFLGEASFGGFYNSTTKTYSFNISTYIQDLINKPLAQYDTYLGTIDLPLTNNINIAPAATTARRSVLGGKNHPQSPIKLKITYTKPN